MGIWFSPGGEVAGPHDDRAKQYPPRAQQFLRVQRSMFTVEARLEFLVPAQADQACRLCSCSIKLHFQLLDFRDVSEVDMCDM